MVSPRWFSVLLVSCGCAALGAVLEKRDEVPKGWTSAGVASSEVTSFTIALQHKFDLLETLLLDVSTPGSNHYGQYWTKAEVDAVFAPDGQVISSVVEWLVSHGITSYKIDGAFIDFSANISTANALLNASYQYYQNNGVTKLRTLHYSVPDQLLSSIALIDPGTFFGGIEPPVLMPSVAPTKTVLTERDVPAQPSVDASCQTSITPACLREMYNVGDYVPDPKSGSVIGFGSFLNESAQISDLGQYEDLNKIPRQNFSVVSIANGTTSQDPTQAGIGEANLDAETIIGVSRPLPVVEFSTGGSPPFIPTLGQLTAADNGNEPYVPYYRYLLSQENSGLPQVISNSYGDGEDSVPYNYAHLTCNLIGLLGLRGITTLFSSGDGGLGGGCVAPDLKTVQFGAAFPATCPYLTAVGGTVSAAPETAWNESSGGFSNYFARPGYQNGTVETYLATQVSADARAYYGQYTNFSGRAFPDVAAHSLAPDFQVVYAGTLARSGGTSASAPVWAGIVGLLNDARLRAGKPALGWLNPMLYAVGKDALVDVSTGYSVGCLPPSQGGSGVVLGARWNATVGWDPVTGWGTPDFQRLKEMVLKL